MRTRCANISCAAVFDADEAISTYGHCPQCNQLMSWRPLEMWHAIDKQSAALEEPARRSKHGNHSSALIVLAEDIRSLWNVGSIFRTADGAGFGKIYLCGITAVPPRKEIAKTSLGAEDVVAWQYCPSSLAAAREIKDAGWQLLGLESVSQRCKDLKQSLDLAAALADGGLRAPLCLALGNEVSGLSAEVLSICDLTCHLPMRGMKESLNVAVAFGVAAYMTAQALTCQSKTCP